MAVADAITKDQQLFCNGSIVIRKVSGCGETVAAGHVLHDEVVLLLGLVCHLPIFAGHDISGAADAVGADDLNGLAAVAGLLGSCGRASRGSCGAGAACIGSGTACQDTGSSQNSAHGQKFTTFHSSVLLHISLFLVCGLWMFGLRFSRGVTSPEAKAPK